MITDVLTPSTGNTTATAEQARDQLGKDEFLKLFVAQLRNQDPLNPMNADQLAAQLAQFSSVEQLIQLNETMAGQSETNKAIALALNGNTALATIGKTVLATGDQVQVTGDASDAVTVSLEGPGQVTLRIFDAAGNEVGSRDVGVLNAGRNEIALGDAASGLAPGQYRYEVEVTGPTGDSVGATTFVKVRVDGVRYGPEGPVLLAGTLEIPLSNVAEIV
ncbi:MAG: hypothetical protein D6701_05465 [Gemmatimonadetes bacterium]|nr:MAG: hypothetical protein D6701_05465 [Gemmatimonadota bacterium]